VVVLDNGGKEVIMSREEEEHKLGKETTNLTTRKRNPPISHISTIPIRQTHNEIMNLRIPTRGLQFVLTSIFRYTQQHVLSDRALEERGLLRYEGNHLAVGAGIE
jgi:hypothetical protein